MSQKSQVKIWEAPCVIPTYKVYPPKKALFSLKNEPTRVTPKSSTPLRG